MEKLPRNRFLGREIRGEPLADPKPQRLDKLLKFEEVDKNRYFDCFYYKHCRNLASDQFWESFSCRWCPVWAEDLQALSFLEKKRKGLQ